MIIMGFRPVQNSKKIDWKGIVDFAEWLAIYGIHYSTNINYAEQRMAVVLLDQSMELMVKALLIKRGYKIQYFRERDIENGLKESESVGKEMMIDYMKALEVLNKNEKELKIDYKAIKHFHEIRNKIYHGAAVNLVENKQNEMEKFIPKFIEFYESAFERDSKETIMDRTPEIINRM